MEENSVFIILYDYMTCVNVAKLEFQCTLLVQKYWLFVLLMSNSKYFLGTLYKESGAFYAPSCQKTCHSYIEDISMISGGWCKSKCWVLHSGGKFTSTSKFGDPMQWKQFSSKTTHHLIQQQWLQYNDIWVPQNPAQASE